MLADREDAIAVLFGLLFAVVDTVLPTGLVDGEDAVVMVFAAFLPTGLVAGEAAVGLCVVIVAVVVAVSSALAAPFAAAGHGFAVVSAVSAAIAWGVVLAVAKVVIFDLCFGGRDLGGLCLGGVFLGLYVLYFLCLVFVGSVFGLWFLVMVHD